MTLISFSIKIILNNINIAVNTRQFNHHQLLLKHVSKHARIIDFLDEHSSLKRQFKNQDLHQEFDLVQIHSIFLILQFQNIENIYSTAINIKSMESTQPAVANFVQKSFEIISNDQNSKVIEWLPSGKEFIIKDTDLFESVILPHYFRHRNINSFIRQLNMYGFHKSRKEPTKNIFSHPNFVKGKPDYLINVRRKLKQDKNDQNYTFRKQKNQFPSSKEQTQELNSREVLKSRQHIENNYQKRQKQLQRTAVKNENLVSLCSMQNIEEFQLKSDDWPFKSLIEKSLIMELNPDVYMKMENITSLNHIDQDFHFMTQQKCLKNDNMDQIQKQRKKFNSRMAGYNILKTINFMSEFQF